MTRIPRAALAVLAALSLLSLVPGTVMAAQPVCGQTLMANTTLTANLDCSAIDDDGLKLAKDGIVLNLNGHTIKGFAGDNDNTGVYVLGVNHTKVKNGTIRDFDYAVLNENASDTVLRNLHLIGDPAGSGEYGVKDYYSAGLIVDNVEVDGAETGMYFEYSASGTVMNSDVSAVDAYYSDGTTRMLFTGNSAAPASGGTGFYENSSSGSRYIGNSSTGGDFGFDLECDGYGRVIVRNNTASGADYGILLAECYNPINDQGSIVTGNTANNNAVYGFQDYKSYNATWMNNVARFNGTGFFFDYPGGAVVKFNIGSRNDVYGFEIHNNSSTDNFAALSRNTANRNDSIGFYSNDYPSPGTGNVARNNGVQNCLMVSCVP